LPVKTASCVCPLGTASLENAVEPLNARSKLLPDVTAENVEAVTPLPHENLPLETPQFPFDDFKVKLELDPDSVYVARVCVDQVPAERSPPVVLDLIMALVGILPGAPVVELLDEVLVVLVELVELVELVVLTGEPDLSGYLIPLEGQEPALGALIGTKIPSMTEP